MGFGLRFGVRVRARVRVRVRVGLTLGAGLVSVSVSGAGPGLEVAAEHGEILKVVAVDQHLDGHRRGGRRRWRGLARATEAVAGRPVARVLP